jgi:hypothetical protein
LYGVVPTAETDAQRARATFRAAYRGGRS